MLWIMLGDADSKVTFATCIKCQIVCGIESYQMLLS